MRDLLRGYLKDENLSDDQIDVIMKIQARELITAYKTGSANGLNELVNDINDFLNKHLDALNIVTQYQKETEYLIGFKQALLMFKNEFDFILNPEPNEEI
jgi:hypothetical protein